MNTDNQLLLNERIRARTVRLVSEDGDTTILTHSEALNNARRQGLDLMMVAAGDPPVCRILDADRFRFERKKVEREQARRKREMAIETKEIQLRPVTDDNDLMTKVRRARGFLNEGDKVKVTVRFRGRERHHRDYGRRIVERFLTEIGEHKVERPLSDGDSDLTIIVGSVVSKADLVRQKSRS